MNDFGFWYTLIVVVLMLLCLMLSVAETTLIILGALFLLVFGGVIGIDEALSGFSNEGMLAVAFLFVVAAALHSTGVFSQATYFLFGRERGYPRAKLMRVLFPLAGMSAFINSFSVAPTAASWGSVKTTEISKR